MRYTHSALTSSGGRSCNEDSVLFLFANNTFTAVVADGLGGEGGGDIASATATRAVSEHFHKNNTCSAQNIAAAVSQVDKAVLMAQSAHEEMKTTIILLHATDNKAYCAHLGDSRLYQFRDGSILFQTRDHSVSQMAVSVGEIPPEEIRHHADRNKLLRALGTKLYVTPDISELDIQSGDAFLLCSDGFWELVFESEMLQCLKKSNNAATWLAEMEAALKPKLTQSSDNYSAVTVIVK